ncbi:hypothetical protein HY950_03685, partial [Candidatus Gottesmanbacteria bacterium]|nr:hypothetical protein [Candidatus Gottesmanbacteria bacterium]
PYRIFRRGILTPNFRSIQSGGLVLDGGLMTLIAARRLHDKAFLQKHDAAVKRIRNWYEKRFGNGLLTEWFQCEWADAVLKSGKTLYTNILYWKATGDKSIKEKIVDTFWNGRYFSDWFDYKRQDYFASHPNMLAIVFGLATRQQAIKILDFAKAHCWNGWTLEENYPAYPWWRIPMQNHLVGMADYHNGLLWLQPGILYAVAVNKVGKKREAQYILSEIAKKIAEFQCVYEVYEKNGQPVKRFMYRSEHPFAWSAGLYLWAYRQIFDR